MLFCSGARARGNRNIILLFCPPFLGLCPGPTDLGKWLLVVAVT